METVEKTKVETKGKIKEMYENYKANNESYYAHQIRTSNELEIMCSQYDSRAWILSYVCEVLDYFTLDSHRVLSAFKKYEETEIKEGIKSQRQFNELTSAIIQLIDKREDIYQWIHELSSNEKFLEENKVIDMSTNELEQLEN